MAKFAEIKDLSEILKGRRHLIVGDIHSCFDELSCILNKLDFNAKQDVLISVGDLCDRGPKSVEVIEFCKALQKDGCFYGVRGNHDDRLIRYLKGTDKRPLKHSTQMTLDDINANWDRYSKDYQEYLNSVLYFFKSFSRIIKLPNGYVVHGGLDPRNSIDRQTKEDCIYMRFFGGEDYFDNVKGDYWFKFLPEGHPRMFFGHEYLENHYPVQSKQVVALDGGCCFGKELRVWDSQTDEVYSVSAFRTYYRTNNKNLKF